MPLELVAEERRRVYERSLIYRTATEGAHEEEIKIIKAEEKAHAA